MVTPFCPSCWREGLKTVLIDEGAYWVCPEELLYFEKGEEVIDFDESLPIDRLQKRLSEGEINREEYEYILRQLNRHHRSDNI